MKQEFAATGLPLGEAVGQLGYTEAELSAMTNAQLRSLVRQTLDHYAVPDAP